MFVAFRADGASHIGSGHVMRCLVLAQALRERQVQVLFICREYPGHLCELIASRGFAVQRLPQPAEKGELDSAQDARETITAMASAIAGKADWLVVDHYQLGQPWESALRVSADRLMVIDDVANRPHDCDLLLDQNLLADMNQRYAGKVPVQSRSLLGPGYALMHADYAEARKTVVPRAGAIRRLFIFFGGADSARLTERSLEAFISLGRADISVDVVIGGNSQHADAISQKVCGHPNIILHSGLPSLAHLMSVADLALGAGGTTHWERLCLGLPCLVVTLSDNQRPSTQELHRLGLVDWLGHHDEVDVKKMAGALKTRLDAGLPVEWSQRCMATVDGLGAERVVLELS